MIVKLLSLLLLTLKTSRCALVIDNAYQSGIYQSDYCPTMKYCKEGAHVMCMYNPKSVMGPSCYNSPKLSITAPLAGHLLDIVNEIRSYVATGKEFGKDRVLLPRGYGIFRLRWDSELATFAQVWANQCLLKRDLCRATKRFPEPSQTSSLVRFRYPNWEYLGNTSAKGLTHEKKVYAINLALRSSYTQKNAVTAAMVRSMPDWDNAPNYYNQSGRAYLNLITGSATHMGCGLSGYTEYVYYQNDKQGLQNTLHLVCNFSASARKGTQTYETKPPKPGSGFSAKCGCPPGFKEDADCLCIDSKKPKPEPDTPVNPKPTCPFGETSSYCDPAVVLLPIFTIEDAPPEKLYQFATEKIDPLKGYVLQRVDNTSVKSRRRAQPSDEMLDIIFNENDAENAIFQPSSTAPPYKKKNTSDIFALTSQELTEFIREKGKKKKPSSVEISAPSFNKEQQSSSQFRLAPDLKPLPLPPPPPRRPPALRPSPPARRYSRPRPSPPLPPLPPPPRIPPPPPPRIEQYSTALQTHVEPRPAKSASRDKKRRLPPKLPPKHHQTEDIKSHAEEIGLNRVEETIIKFDKFLGQKNSSNYNDKDVDTKDDNDNKLLYLLDTLEREVNHKALDGDEKQLLDAKIRKIYGTIVGKTEIPMFPKKNLYSTPDPEADEIDFGDTKSRDQFEPNQKKRFKIDQSVERVKHPNPSVHGHKWKKNLNKRYNENHLDNEYNEVPRKYDENLDHPHHYDIAARNKMKHQAGRTVFRDDEKKLKRRVKSLGTRNENDILNLARRIYYHEKLNNIKRKLRARRNGRKNDPKNERTLRRMLMKNLESPKLRSKDQADQIYMPERARFLHGF